MFDESGPQIAVLVLLFIAAALVAASLSWKRHKREPQRSEPEREYVWLAIVRGQRESPPRFDRVSAEADVDDNPRAESAEDTYRGAYLLLIAGLRMELTMAKMETPTMGATALGFDIVSRPRVTRIAYTTEAFRPYMDKVKSLKDFGRYAPYREGWLTMMKLSVHPEDADEAVRMLEREGMTVERPDGQHWWH